MARDALIFVVCVARELEISPSDEEGVFLQVLGTKLPFHGWKSLL
jgi:hypothetical protein